MCRRNHIRHISLLPVVNTIINENNTPELNVYKLAQAGYNGDIFLEKYIFHCRRKHAVQAKNLVQRSWNFAVIIMTCLARTTLNKSALKKLLEYTLTETLSASPLRAKHFRKWSRHEITDERTDHEVDLGGPMLVQEVEG